MPFVHGLSMKKVLIHTQNLDKAHFNILIEVLYELMEKYL